MRRTLTVLLATVAGLVLVLSFHTTPESSAVTSPVSGTTGRATSSTTAPAGSGPPPTTAGSTAVRTFTGAPELNRYGTVQVRITVTGSKVTDVTALQMPSDRAHSERLSVEAGPILRSEAIQAQSARLDIVSGATFTSESYAQSLQSALDQAALGR